MKSEVSICWLRRDLRLNDQAALHHALNSNYPVLLVFIFDKDILDKLSDKEDRRVSFIYQTLSNLNSELIRHGSAIYVLHDTVPGAFQKLSESFLIREVYTKS